MLLFISSRFSLFKLPTEHTQRQTDWMSYSYKNWEYIYFKAVEIQRFTYVLLVKIWALFWIMEGSGRHIIFCHLVPPFTKLYVYTQNWCIQRNPCFAAVRVRNERYQQHQTTVSKAMFQYFACSGSHMVCYISSLKSPPCILLSSILRDSPPCNV